jgi:hypothetical protein
MEDEREKDFDDEYEVDSLDDEDSIDWLEHFTTEAPGPILNFHSEADAQQVRLSQKVFNKRLSQCLDKCMVGRLPLDMTAALYKMAVMHNQQIDAYEEYLKTIKGEEFNNTLKYVQTELIRVGLISAVLEIQEDSSLPRQLSIPRQMFEWDNIWMGSMRELVRRIKSQLESCDQELVGQRQYWLNLGRTKIETHLLDSALSTIVTQLKERKLRLDKHCVLVAYAHAALLVPYLESDGKKASVAAMKARMYRARKSKNKGAMLTLFLAQMLKWR